MTNVTFDTTVEDRRTTGTDSSSNAAGESSADERMEERSDLSRDHIYELLSNERRREIFKFLYEMDGETSLGRLAEHISSLEASVEADGNSTTQKERVIVSLHHCHLPKMDSVNAIDYDRSRRTIELRDEVEQVFPHLTLESSGATLTVFPREE